MAHAKSVEEQVEILMQGTEYGDPGLAKAMEKELEERLRERNGGPLRVYGGFDPRTADLHLGHTVPIRKLRQFQDLGHDVTFLVGTATAMVGDPSDKDQLRPRLDPRAATENARTYAEQAFRILDPERTCVRYNHEWLEQLRLRDLIELASLFSVQQLLTRETFRKRWGAGDALYLHEMMYTALQGLDACTLEADVQVGGSDQLFNIVTASRKVMTARGLQPNIAIITGILPGTDGVTKMSKSLGNHIAITATPEEMYAKIMALPDAAMETYFLLVTRREAPEIRRIMAEMKTGTRHPKDVKGMLARDIVAAFFDPDAALRAEAARGMPAQLPVAALTTQEGVAALLVRCGLATSRTDARRLLGEGAVRLDDVRLSDPMAPPPGPGLLRVGRRYVRLVDRPPDT